MPTYGTIVISESQTIESADHNGDYKVIQHADVTFHNCTINGRILFCAGCSITLSASTCSGGIWETSEGCGDL